MGRFKPLLPWPVNGSGTVIEATVTSLVAANIAGIVVVVGYRGEEIADRLADYPVTVCRNDHPEAPMSSSVKIAMPLIPALSDVLVLPGDHPGVAGGTISAILQAASDHPGEIVVPVWRGRRGHPALFPARVRRAMEEPDPREGLRYLMRGSLCPVREIAVEDPGIRLNLDTPADYAGIEEVL